MKALSFDRPPINGKVFHQIVDCFACVMGGMGGKVRISAGGQNAAMTKNLLNLK